MENRIKEQLMLFSDRTSTHYLRSNQLRLYFSSLAYVERCARKAPPIEENSPAKKKTHPLQHSTPRNYLATSN